MIPISDDDLVLKFYGESPRGEEIARMLETVPSLAARYAELVSVLGAVEGDDAPERPADYEAEVWQRVQWKLRDTPETQPWWRRWFAIPTLAPAGAVAALLVLAFVVGRWGPGAPPVAPIASEVRERILLVDVSQHLGAAEMVLVEMLNAEDGSGELELARSRAGELLANNRLYRQVVGQNESSPQLAAVLDELDRVLTELRNSPASGSDASFAGLQQTLRSNGTLFKIRVLRTRVDEKARSLQPGQAKARI